METPSEPLDRAISAAGGIVRLATLMNLGTYQAIQAWRRTRVPAEYCPTIERLTGVACEEMRPDVDWAVLRCGCLAGRGQAIPQTEAA